MISEPHLYGEAAVKEEGVRPISVWWSNVDKEDYLLAMERSPIKDIEIKFLLKTALNDKIADREVYMKGIDQSYHYEGYNAFRTADMNK